MDHTAGELGGDSVSRPNGTNRAGGELAQHTRAVQNQVFNHSLLFPMCTFPQSANHAQRSETQQVL